jgi:ribosome-associated heat shock protein Hsp15
MTAGTPVAIAVRLDKWLWAARFFPTRAVATQAIEAGKVHVNSQRAKASRNLLVGDQLTIRAETELFAVTVLALAKQRRPAAEARLLYEESEESQARRQREQEMRQLAKAAGGIGVPAGAGRPGKRDRRKIIAFVRKGEQHEKD